MRVVIYRRRRFEKRLSELRRGGGKAALVAQQVEQLIREMANGHWLIPEQLQALTKHGEARIAGCRKFDLRGGYRFIYVKRGDALVILWVGMHDECDTWIANHTGLDPDPNVDCEEIAPDSTPEQDCAQAPLVSDKQEDSDETLYPIEDAMLRRIFRGICKEG